MAAEVAAAAATAGINVTRRRQGLAHDAHDVSAYGADAPEGVHRFIPLLGPSRAGHVGPMTVSDMYDHNISAAGAAQGQHLPPNWLTVERRNASQVQYAPADSAPSEAVQATRRQQAPRTNEPATEPRMRRRMSIEEELERQRQFASQNAPTRPNDFQDQAAAPTVLPPPAHDFTAMNRRQSISGVPAHQEERFVTASGVSTMENGQPIEAQPSYMLALDERQSNTDVTDAQVTAHNRMMQARDSTAGYGIETAAHQMRAVRGMHNAPVQPPRDSQTYAFDNLRDRESAPDVVLQNAMEEARVDTFMSRHRPSVAGVDAEMVARAAASMPYLHGGNELGAPELEGPIANRPARHDPRSHPPRSADGVNRESAPSMLDPRAVARAAAMRAPPKRVVSAHAEVFDRHTQDTIDGEIAAQRASRKTFQPRREGEREISGHFEAGTDHTRNRGDPAATSKWERAKQLLDANKKTIHLGAVNPDAWTDVNALFHFYDQTYFEHTLTKACTWSWLDREEDDTEFRYCLCSTVPPWWQGSRMMLCAGICCKLQKSNTGALAKHCHIRIPISYRRFRLHVQVKETLLHSMIHAYLYLNDKLVNDEPFYAHGNLFKQMMHHINSNKLTFDCFRPTGGYKVIYTDHVDDEEKEARIKHMLDTFDDEHWKILYLMSKYSHVAETWDDKEMWVRKIPLTVLIYEGVVSNVFDFDYAPTSVFVNNKRIYINESKEAQDHVDDLVEAGLVRALRMMDKYNRPSIAYQVLPTSVKLLERRDFPVQDKRLVNSLIRTPGDAMGDDDPVDELDVTTVMWEEKLLTVTWNDDEEIFVLNDDEGALVRESTVTEVEDVSYVTSPYIPVSMRKAGLEVTSNAHRAHESSYGATNIKDEMDVQISLTDVLVFIAEWIPTGVSQMTDLSNRLGVLEHNKGGYLTETIDENPGETMLEVPTGLTRVSINSYDPSDHVMLETVVDFPEEPGIVQVEHFGMRFDQNGTSFNSLRVESVSDKVYQDISLDSLSRVMVDITVDSSEVVGSLLSTRQRVWLKTVFGENVNSRQKMQLFIASRIEPKMRAKRYLDGDAMECEIKQVIGDTQHAFDVNETDVLIFGSEGLLYAGPEWKQHEDTLLSYMSVQARTTFLDSFNTSLFATDDDLKDVHQMLAVCEYESSGLPAVTSKIFELSERLLIMEEVLYLLNDSLEQNKKISAEKRRLALSKEGVKLLHLLQVVPKEISLAKRCVDLFNKLKQWTNDVELLRRRAKQMNEIYKERLKRDVAYQYRLSGVLSLTKIGDEGAYALMGGIYCARFAFRALDRIVGGYSLVFSEGWYRVNLLYPIVLSEKFYWLIGSIAVWCALAAATFRALMQYRESRLGRVRWMTVLNQPYDPAKLAVLLKEMNPVQHTDTGRSVTLDSTISYELNKRNKKQLKRWNNTLVRITMTIDAKACILRRVLVSYAKPLFAPVTLLPMDMASIFMKEMETRGILGKDFKHKTGLDAILDSQSESQSIREVRTPHKVYFVARQGDDVWREVHVYTIGIEHFRERTSEKFDYEPLNLLEVLVVDDATYRSRLPEASRDKSIPPTELHDNPKVTMTPIHGDVDLEMTQNYARFFVTFRGRPEPSRTAFKNLYKRVMMDAQPGAKLSLKDMAGATV